ncbi:MAG: hypothetical protein LBD16_08045 [Oscillospiraceae bacterium]|jgi:hypothetical protein|nr:hypothetical protein [Oscillospiraceae bacterium]
MVVLLAVSFAFYSLNMTGFRVKNFILVESCVKTEPIDIPFWILFALCLGLFVFAPNIGKYAVLGYMTFGCITMYFNHVRYMVFGCGERKLKGYNECFGNTHHIIKQSDTRLVPDTFHLALTAMVFVNLIGILIYILA